METRDERGKDDAEKLLHGVLILDAKVLGFTAGILCGLSLFIATNWLVVKGGEQVGRNLQLLSQYFIGYRVSFFGSIIGFFYGFAFGTLGGALVGWIYNRITLLRMKMK